MPLQQHAKTPSGQGLTTLDRPLAIAAIRRCGSIYIALEAAGAESLSRLWTKQPQDTPWDSLEREFAALSVDGSLPANFSRVDIYADHHRAFRSRSASARGSMTTL